MKQIIVMLILGILFGFALSQGINTSNFSVKEIPESKQDIINDCKNLNLEKTSKCLISNIRTFYKFNSTKDSVSLSFEELKERGGDCRNYALLYEELGKELGFTSTTIPLDRDNNKINDHRIAFLSDGNDYCILDQTEFWCKDLKDE